MAAKKTTTPKMPVRIRMYRQGLGDCFLLTLPGKGDKPFHMLIDCGVVLGSPGEQVDKLRSAVADVAAETKGELDLLIVTHEHWDHVSGFVQAETEFGGLRVKQTWLAWTENPSDALATKLRKERRTAENALRMAAQHLAMDGRVETAERVDSLVGFFGAKAGSTEDAMDRVKKIGAKKPRFCTPGEPPIVLDEVPGFRFFVMGPPKDEKLIKKSNPNKGDAYGLDAGAGGAQAFLVSALRRGMDAAAPMPGESTDDPFDAMFAIPMARAAQIPFFQDRYFGDSPDKGIYDRSEREAVKDQSWRRIDAEWMDSTEAMALQLDAATNNTSLVLAIQMPDGEVLLFPGDAQAGSWLSWQDLAWEYDDEKTGRRVRLTGPDLLARTVFYKVGHHGSHNATLRAKGLELMTNEALTAMIPVDHDMAVKKRWGRMPLPELTDALTRHTRGRLLRVDDAERKPGELAKRRPKLCSAAEWAEFTDRVQVTDLYFDLHF